MSNWREMGGWREGQRERERGRQTGTEKERESKVEREKERKLCNEEEKGQTERFNVEQTKNCILLLVLYTFTMSFELSLNFPSKVSVVNRIVPKKKKIEYLYLPQHLRLLLL